MAKGDKGGRQQQGPSPTVVQALKEYERQRSDEALQGVLRLVEEGTHGSAACVAAVKALLLHAAQVSERQRGPEGEEAAAHLLLQATEAAAHGALRHRSIQLLEALHHLMLATRGNKHHVDRRHQLLSLLQNGADLRGWQAAEVASSPLLPVQQLLAEEGTPRSSIGARWWDNVPFADWAHPAAEAVGSSTFPWECARPYANLADYQEAVRQHASMLYTTHLSDMLGQLHAAPPDKMSKRSAVHRRLQQQFEQVPHMSKPLQERLASAQLLPKATSAALRKKLGIKAEVEREVALQVSKLADKAPRRREQPTAEERKRALQRKLREEREARELAEAHSRAKVVADFLRLKLEQAGGGGAAADALAVVCQVARMPWEELLAQLAQLPGALNALEGGANGESASAKEKEMNELFAQIEVVVQEYGHGRQPPQEVLPLYRSPYRHSNRYSPDGDCHLDWVARSYLPSSAEEVSASMEQMEGMRGVVEAGQKLRRAVNELLPQLGALTVLNPEGRLDLLDDEPQGAVGSVLERLKISEPRTHVPKSELEAVPVLAHPSIPCAMRLPHLRVTVADLRELCGLPAVPDPPPAPPQQQGQAAAALGSWPPGASGDGGQQRSGSSTPDVSDGAGAGPDEELGVGQHQQEAQEAQRQRRQWAWAAEEAGEEDEVEILQAISRGSQQQQQPRGRQEQQPPAAAEAAGSQDAAPQPVPGRRRLLSLRSRSSSGGSDGGGGSHPASGLVVEESVDAASDADTASASGDWAGAVANSRSSSAQSSRSEDLSSFGSWSSSSTDAMWPAEKVARQLGREWDMYSSDATRSRSTSRYGSSPERGSGSSPGPAPPPRLPVAVRRQVDVEHAANELKHFLLLQTMARGKLRGLFVAEHFLAEAPTPVPPAYSKAPILQLAHTVLDRSLRPVLLATWLLRCVEQVEPETASHLANLATFTTEDMLQCAGHEDLARLAAVWRSPLVLSELVQQAEPADVAQRVEAIMKEQLGSLLRSESLKSLPSANSEALDEVRLDVQLEYSSRVIRALLCGGDELHAEARPSLEAGQEPGLAWPKPVHELGSEAAKYKHRLVCFVLRGLRLLRETQRLTRPLWGVVLRYLSELRDEQAEIRQVELEYQEAENEMGLAYLRFIQKHRFTERDWHIWRESYVRLDEPCTDKQEVDDVALRFNDCLMGSEEGRAWRAASERVDEAKRRLQAIKSVQFWDCRSNNSEGSDELSSASRCVDDGSEPWLRTMTGLPLALLEQLYAFVATQVAHSYAHITDIGPSLKGVLEQADALAALQLVAEPSTQVEGQPQEVQQPTGRLDLALRPEGLAKVLGAQPAASADQLVASFATLAAGLVPADDGQAAAAASAAAAAAPAEQAGSAAGRGEGRPKRGGPARAFSGALLDSQGAPGRGAAGDLPAVVLGDTFERQELRYRTAGWAAHQMHVLMLAVGGLAHTVRGVVEVWEFMQEDELVDELLTPCHSLSQLGTHSDRVGRLIGKLGAAVLQLCCAVDQAVDLCAAFAGVLQLGTSRRLCQALEMAQHCLADGRPVDPLELDSSRPPPPTELDDRLHECREDAKEAQEELERLLKLCGRDVSAWLRSKDQADIAAAAQPLVKLREVAGEYGWGLGRVDPGERVRLTKAAATSVLDVLRAAGWSTSYMSAKDEAQTLLVLQAECHCASLRLLSATWSCYGGALLPLDGAARAMLRYLLPPVWKQELDAVEGERRKAAQLELMQEEEDRVAAAEAAAAKRKAKKKKGKKAAAAGADDEQQQQQQQQAATAEQASEAHVEEAEEAAAEESLGDLALLLGRKQTLPAQQQPAQQAAAAQPGAAAAQEQPQESRRRKGRKKGGGSGDGAPAAAGEEEEQAVPEGYLRMMAELQAAEQANEQQRQQQSQLQPHQEEEPLDPEVLQMLEAMHVSEQAAQQQAPPPPPVARGQAAAPLPVAPAQQPPTPQQQPQLGAAGVQPARSEQDHSLEAQLAAASAFDWTIIEGAEAEASWQSSSSAAPAPDWQDAAAAGHKPRHKAPAAGAPKQQSAAPPAAAPPRKSMDRSKARVVGWDGRWVCKCGQEHAVRDTCKLCRTPAPCRDFLKGSCPYPSTCVYTHLQFDLPEEGPPPGSKPLVCPPSTQQQPKPAGPKHDERLARVVSWRGEYVCPCGVRRFMQHACTSCGYGPVCRDWVRGHCDFGASCRFSHPLFDLAGAPSVPSEERVVLGRLSDLPQWRPPGAASSTAARPTSRPGTASSAAARRPQSGSSAQSALLAAPEAAVAAVCAQFGMAAEELEAMLGPDGLQDALEQVQLQEAERASLLAGSSAGAPPAPAPAAPPAALAPPPPPPRPLSAAPAGPAVQYAEPARPVSAASQAHSGDLPAPSSSAGGMRIVSSEGAWVCHCGASNTSKRPRCQREGCTQLAPCRKWMLGTCPAPHCQYPHPPFDPAGDWGAHRGREPKAVLWQGAPFFGAPQPPAAAAAPQPAAAVPQEAPAQDDGDLNALLQNLGIGDSSDGGWGEEAQGGSSAAAANVGGMAPAAHNGGVAAPAHAYLPAMATPGLQNEAGEYNCFLNAIIQCLWRCANFRQQLAAWGPAVCGRDPVVSALYSLFAAFAAEEQQLQQAGPLQSTAARRGLVNPSELRQALSALPGPQQYRVGEMNDAGEVLLTIYERVMEVLPQQEGGQGSPIQRMFGMLVDEHVRCHSCGRVTQQCSYTQFYHNIQAASLRMARGLYPQADSMLMLMRLLEQQHMKTCDQDVGGCGIKNSVRHTLLHPPHVFTLQLGWKSQREEPHTIAATLAAVDETANLAEFYEGVPPHTPHYALRSMVCYYGQHYSAFVWAPDFRAWLLFDDVRVSRVGSWADVRRKCEAGRIQPSVLFYEAVA